MRKNAFVAHLGQPPFGQFGLGAGDGLDQAEDALSVGAVEVLRATSGGDGKGGGWQFAPTLWPSLDHDSACP